MLDTERAIDAALKCDFDPASCEHLWGCLQALRHLIIDEACDLPIHLSEDAGLAGKALLMIDLAFCCWRNDGAAIPLPDDVLLNHIARMKLNSEHCKTVLDFTRLFLGKYDRLLSVESAALRLP